MGVHHSPEKKRILVDYVEPAGARVIKSLQHKFEYSDTAIQYTSFRIIEEIDDDTKLPFQTEYDVQALAFKKDITGWVIYKSDEAERWVFQINYSNECISFFLEDKKQSQEMYKIISQWFNINNEKKH